MQFSSDVINNSLIFLKCFEIPVEGAGKRQSIGDGAVETGILREPECFHYTPLSFGHSEFSESFTFRDEISQMENWTQRGSLTCLKSTVRFSVKILSEILLELY